jgi:hypothetical protein
VGFIEIRWLFCVMVAATVALRSRVVLLFCRPSPFSTDVTAAAGSTPSIVVAITSMCTAAHYGYAVSLPHAKNG